MIRTTYSDRICYRPGAMIASAVSGQDMLSSGCDDRECRVRIGYAIVQVCDVRKHRVPAWGIRMELLRMGPYTMHTLNSVRVTFHLLRISHIRNSVRLTFHLLRIFHIWCLTPYGRGGRFNFPGQTYSDPLIALTRRVSYPFCTVSRCSPEAYRYVRPTF